MAKAKERTFISDQVPKNSFLFFKEMRNKKELCDITFLVGEESISAHRIILAAVMPHFLKKSSPENDADVGMPDVEPNAFKCLIQFAYGCEVKINTENVRDLLSAACSLGVTEVRKECCEFLADTLALENVLSTRLFADELNCSELLESTHCYIKENFTSISETTDFLKLPLHYLKQLINEDNLNVKNEDKVFSAVMKWVKECPEDRSSELPELLLKIRMPLIQPQCLMGIVKMEDLLQTSATCRDLISEAINYNLFPQLRNALCSFRTEPRHSSAIEDEKQNIYILFGETNFSVHCYDFLQEKIVSQAVQKYIITTGSTVEFQKNIYIFLNDTYFKYDFCRKSFEYVNQMPAGKRFAGATSSQNEVYFFGGKVGKSASNSVECYDPEKGEWKILSSMPTARWGLCAVTLRKHVFTLGGMDPCYVLDQVERYDPVRNKWSVMPPMLSKRTFAGATALNGKIYVCGGSADLRGRKCLAMAEVYDPFRNTWEYISPMSYSRHKFFLLSCRGKLHAIGGKTEHLMRPRMSEMYDPEKDEWSSGIETDPTIDIFGAVVI